MGFKKLLDESRKFRKRDKGVSASQHVLNRLKAFVWMEGGKKAVEEDAGKTDGGSGGDLIDIVSPGGGDRESTTGE